MADFPSDNANKDVNYYNLLICHSLLGSMCGTQ